MKNLVHRKSRSTVFLIAPYTWSRAHMGNQAKPPEFRLDIEENYAGVVAKYMEMGWEDRLLERLHVTNYARPNYSVQFAAAALVVAAIALLLSGVDEVDAVVSLGIAVLVILFGTAALVAVVEAHVRNDRKVDVYAELFRTLDEYCPPRDLPPTIDAQPKSRKTLGLFCCGELQDQPVD